MEGRWTSLVPSGCHLCKGRLVGLVVYDGCKIHSWEANEVEVMYLRYGCIVVGREE